MYDLEGRVTERGTHKKGKLEGVAKLITLMEMSE